MLGEVETSESGPTQTSRNVAFMSAIWGKDDSFLLDTRFSESDHEQTFSWRPIHFGAYVIMAPSVSTGDGGRNVAGEYLVAEPLDYFHFAEAPDWFTGWCHSPIPKQDLLPR
jgi:hypothetical protein